jgi:YHS domain-containing protein
MSSENAIPLPVIGGDVLTACGTPEKFNTNTPRALYNGEWIFFCLPICRQEFLQDPNNSCLTSHVNIEAE